MAYPIATKTLRDTAAETIVHTTGLCGSGEIGAANIFDCSAATYGLATITLSAVTTASDRWCIGEIISSSDGTPIHMVVQDHVLGSSTLQVYRCTSASNPAPLGWTGTTYPGATKTFQYTRIWPDSLQAHNSSFKSKDDVIEEDKKLANIINDAKKTCSVLGFKEESEKFADCMLKLYTQKVEELVAEKQLKNQQIMTSQSSSSNSSSNQSSGSNVTTIYDPVRDSQNLMNKGQKMLSGSCTLGVNC